MTKRSAITLPTLPTACSYGNEISTLHIIAEGQSRQVRGSGISGGYFSRLIASRAGIVTLLAPVFAGRERQFSPPYDRSALEERGLFILPIAVAANDWLLAVEEQGGCDPGWEYHLLLGRLPQGVRSASELFHQVSATINLLDISQGTVPFQEFQLWPPQPTKSQ